MVGFNGFSNSFLTGSFGFSTKNLQVASASLAGSATTEASKRASVDSLLTDEYIPSTDSLLLDQAALEATETLKSPTAISVETAASENETESPDSPETGNTDGSSKVSIDFSTFMKKVGMGTAFGASKSKGTTTSAMEKIGHDIEKKIYQGIITRVVESKGVKLGSGDVLAFSVDGTGTISINAKTSKVAGYASKPENPVAGEKYIEDLCGSIAADLNKESVGGSSFGDALLKHYAGEMGYDYEAVKGDESFSISFSFRYNEKTGTNEMMNARIVNQMSSDAARDSSDASAKLAERKAKREEKEAMRASARTAGEAGKTGDVAASEADAVSETEAVANTAAENGDETGHPRSGEVSLDEFEQTYQDRYVKPNVRYGKFSLIDPPQQPLFKREGDRLVPADPNLTFEEALAKTEAYQQYLRGESFSEVPSGEADDRVGVLKVMYNDFSFDLIGTEGAEACALYGWQTQELNGDAHVAQGYRDRIDAEREALDGRIGQLLDEKGISPDEGESLRFDVGPDGRITLTGGIADAERAASVEAALNEDETLGRELLLNHVRQDMGHRQHSGNDFMTDPVNSRIIANEVLRNETGLTLDDIEFDEKTVTFRDKNGKVDLTAVSKDYMVWQGLYNSFQWNGDAYESAEALSVSFTYTGTR